MEERKGSRHKLVLEERENAVIVGISDVVSFDEEEIVAETDIGVLIVKGENLHVSRLNIEKGELDIDGYITSISYEDENSFTKDKGSFFGKIFK